MPSEPDPNEASPPAPPPRAARRGGVRRSSRAKRSWSLQRTGRAVKPADLAGTETRETTAPAAQVPPEPAAPKTTAAPTPPPERPAADTSAEELTTAPDSLEPATESAARTTRARSRLAGSLVRPSRGQLVVAVLLALFGLAVVSQIRALNVQDPYGAARPQELIQILDGITKENQRLAQEVEGLEKTRRELETGTDAQGKAREENRKRIEQLEILAGTRPVTGSGIRVTIFDPNQRLKAASLLDAVQELRNAGAEAIEINNSIRVVASSYFVDDGSRLLGGGEEITRPIKLSVIGEPATLEQALRFNGGLFDLLGTWNAPPPELSKESNLEIKSLHRPKKNQYALPKPSG